MDRFLDRVRGFLKDDSGVCAAEYAVLLSLIVVATIGPVTFLGDKLVEMFGEVAEVLSDINSTM